MTIRVPEAGVGPGEVHVWRAPLRSANAQTSSLSDHEMERAETYFFDEDRARFVAARVMLREILGGYLVVPPGEVVFGYGSLGKPWLENDRHLRFNLSHSTDVALIAVGREVELGVDVESQSMLVDPDSIAACFMSDREHRLLGRISSEKRSAAILTAWVRKEAVAKGRGDGLGVNLATIETRPGEPALATPVVTDTASQNRWFLWDVPMGPRRAGALAASRNDLVIQIADHTGLVHQVGASPQMDAAAGLTA